MNEIRLITLDPAHFHAALVHKAMYDGVARQASVYAPLGSDVLAHLQHIAGLNARKSNPTNWQLRVHVGADFLERMLADRPGDVVVLAGRNRRKISYILAALQAGLHVLADKPWIINAMDFGKLETALNIAAEKGLIAFDIMTERYEITSILMRELVNDAEVIGDILPGSEQEPAAFMESVHYLKKLVAGVPLRRPVTFFNIHEQGEGLTDVGTHLVDLVQWILFPNQPIDHGADIQLLAAWRWPTTLSVSDYRSITGEEKLPGFLLPHAREDAVDYSCNNAISYRLKGAYVKLNVLWGLEADSPAGDIHRAVIRGTRSRVEIRHGNSLNERPALCAIPNCPSDHDRLLSAVAKRLERLHASYPRIGVAHTERGIEITIPGKLRTSHEAHFGEVTRQFLRYVRDPKSLPAWEKPNMLAKYHVTTAGVHMAREPGS